MKTTDLVSAAGLLSTGTLLLVLTLGPANEGTQASGGTGGDPQIIGLDVIPDASNTAITLGNIDTCVAVTHPATLNVDVFLDDVPTGKDLGGFNHSLNYNKNYLTVSACHNADLYLMGSTAGSAVVNFGDACPDANGALGVVASDTMPAAAEPAGSRGVLERYTLTTVAPGPHTVGLTLTSIVVADNAAQNWWATHGDQVWDANYHPQYGLIAIDEPCTVGTVGGMAELADVAQSSIERSDSLASRARSARHYALLAGAVAAAAVALAAGGWYARRRLS